MHEGFDYHPKAVGQQIIPSCINHRNRFEGGRRTLCATANTDSFFT